MKIALLGYGKMGKTIEKIAIDRGHEIVLKVEKTEDLAGIEKAEVAIDFSIPAAAFENITTALTKGVAVVSGTTGWLEQYHEAVSICQKNKGKFIYASNYSLGVNLFFNLNEHLAQLMSNFPEYNTSIDEIHHTQKLDSPSGTAISLAEQVIEKTAYNKWIHSEKAPEENELPIYAQRIDDVKGTHHVCYTSEIDTIEISHIAHTREGFALGAVVAAEWLTKQDKHGVFTMKNVLSQLMA
jgi:4-hydroxy-tetrahydrodipicolinate reductase